MTDISLLLNGFCSHLSSRKIMDNCSKFRQFCHHTCANRSRIPDIVHGQKTKYILFQWECIHHLNDLVNNNQFAMSSNRNICTIDADRIYSYKYSAIAIISLDEEKLVYYRIEFKINEQKRCVSV